MVPEPGTRLHSPQLKIQFDWIFRLPYKDGMKLTDFLSRPDSPTRTAFAKDVGVSPAYITALCAEEYWPSRRVVTAITRATGGAVTANDFLKAEAAE